MERTSLSLALAVLGGLLSGSACVVTSSGPDSQDACRIGAVSPDDYRALAAEIAARPPIDWDAALEAHPQSEGVATAFRERLEQVLVGRTSADEQIAAMHALMRSIGAEFGWAESGTSLAFYHYRLDVNRIGMSRFVLRWAWLTVSFYIDERPRAVRNLRKVIVRLPYWGEPGQPGLKPIPQLQPCPPLPAEIQ